MIQIVMRGPSLGTCIGILAAAVMMAAAGARVRADTGYLSHLRQGTDLLGADSGRQAEEEFTAANCDDYVDPLGWIGLGAARLSRGQVEGALADFERAAQFAEAGSSQAQGCARLADFGRAVCLLQRGQVAAARQALDRLAQEGFISALPAQAYADLAAGDKASALNHAKIALEQFPQDALTLSILGRTLPPAQALMHLRRALDLCPGSPYAAPLSALALPNRGQPTAQENLVRIQITDAPERRAVVTWLGEDVPQYFVIKVDGSPGGMSNSPPHEFGLPRELGPGPHGIVVEAWSSTTLLGRGAVVLWPTSKDQPANRYDSGDYDAALAGLRAAIMPFPNRVHLHYWLAAAYAAAGSRPLALANYERVVTLDPNFADARQRLVTLCKALGVQGSTRALTRGPDKRAYLTFDDGPHPVYTGRILAALRKAGVRATFFVVGTQARAHPELLRAIAAAGHEIANHTYSHDDMTTKPPAQVQQELLRTGILVADATGKRPRLFRPPGGRHNAKVRAAAAQVGYTTVTWSANISACAGLSGGRAVGRLLRDIGPGAIILLHNGPDQSADILPGLVAALKKRGYSFGMLSQAARK